ncbi:MAG: alanine racemase [Dehalobacterium sp.]
MQDFVRWIEIDLDAITYNFHQIRQFVPEQVKIMSVVKADAYGHGAVQVAEALAGAGTDMFAVTTVEEGIELVNGGVRLPILIFTPMLPFQVETVMKHQLIPTVDHVDSLEALAKWAEKSGTRVRFHLKVESGMGRTGITAADLPNLLQKLNQYSGVLMGGVYSHFATAMMKEKSYAQKQLAQFLQMVKEIKKETKEIGLTHIANSAAILDLPDTYLDMVRVGTLLYGQYPSSYVSRPFDLKDPWQMKGRIVSVKKLAPGHSVGYGRDYMVKKPLEVGVVPVGYADGFGVLPHTRPAKAYDLVKSTAKIFSHMLGVVSPNYVLYGKDRLPVIGRIGMQLSMIDITGQNIGVGTEVKIPIRRTTSGARLPRIFFKNGQISSIRTISQSL